LGRIENDSLQKVGKRGIEKVLVGTFRKKGEPSNWGGKRKKIKRLIFWNFETTRLPEGRTRQERVGRNPGRPGLKGTLKGGRSQEGREGWETIVALYLEI